MCQAVELIFIRCKHTTVCIYVSLSVCSLLACVLTPPKERGDVRALLFVGEIFRLKLAWEHFECTCKGKSSVLLRLMDITLRQKAFEVGE